MHSNRPIIERVGDHFHRWRVVYICAAVGVGLWFVDRWAESANRQRDAGITWLYAYSPRTLQSYEVRATVEDGRLVAFHLEHGETYRFSGCTLPDRDHKVECRDGAGQAWMIEP